MKRITEASLARRFKAVMDDAVELARRRGAKDPFLFIEGTAGMVVLDGAPFPADGTERGEEKVWVGWGGEVDYGQDVGGW